MAVTPNMCERSELGSFKIKLFNEKIQNMVRSGLKELWKKHQKVSKPLVERA